jgi:putative NADH-flavin reductase
VGLELTKAYLEKRWKVIAAVRDPSKMKQEGDMMVVKLEVGEKEDAKKVRPSSSSPFLPSKRYVMVVGRAGSS